MLNYWNATWSLDEKQCPCDIHLCDYLEEKKISGKTVFHFGTGNHHILGLHNARSGLNNAVLGITASPDEYQAYIKLLIDNPTLGATYKAYFGDIYQLDRRLLPDLDIASLFHVGEYRTEHNDKYGALTDTEMILLCADRLKPGGEIHFYTGSFAYDKTFEAAAAMLKSGSFVEAEKYKSLQILRKTA